MYQMLKMIPNPLLLIGHHLQAYLYARPAYEFRYCVDFEQKVDELLDCLRNVCNYVTERTLIICNTDDEVSKIVDTLQENGIPCDYYDSKSTRRFGIIKQYIEITNNTIELLSLCFKQDWPPVGLHPSLATKFSCATTSSFVIFLFEQQKILYISRYRNSSKISRIVFRPRLTAFATILILMWVAKFRWIIIKKNLYICVLTIHHLQQTQKKPLKSVFFVDNSYNNRQLPTIIDMFEHDRSVANAVPEPIKLLSQVSKRKCGLTSTWNIQILLFMFVTIANSQWFGSWISLPLHGFVQCICHHWST